MLLDAIIILVCLIVVGIISALMAIIGIHAYRLFGAVFGLVLGFGIVHYANTALALNIAGTYLIAEYAFVCIVFALLGFFVKAFALGMGGAVTGFIYGIGIVSLADYALGYSIPPAVFTAGCIAIILLAALYCLLRPRAGAIFSTSLTGAYSAALSIYLMIVWYHSTSAVSPVLSFDAIIGEFNKLFASVQPEVKGILLAAGLLAGILFMFLQYRSTRPSVIISKRRAIDSDEAPAEQPKEYTEPQSAERAAVETNQTVQQDFSDKNEPEIIQQAENTAVTMPDFSNDEAQPFEETKPVYEPEPQKFPPRRSFRETAAEISKKYSE